MQCASLVLTEVTMLVTEGSSGLALRVLALLHPALTYWGHEISSGSESLL